MPQTKLRSIKTKPAETRPEPKPRPEPVHTYQLVHFIDDNEADNATSPKLSKSEYETLITALAIHRKERGWPTPGDSFIYNLIQIRERKGTIVPADIEHELEDFRSDHSDIVKGAKDLLQCHPEEVGLDKLFDELIQKRFEWVSGIYKKAGDRTGAFVSAEFLGTTFFKYRFMAERLIAEGLVSGYQGGIGHLAVTEAGERFIDSLRKDAAA